MTQEPLALLLLTQDPASAQAWVSCVLSHWPQDDRPTPRLLTPGSLDPHRTDLAWVVADHENDPTLAELLVTLDEQQVPALLSTPRSSYDTGTCSLSGAVSAPMDAPPALVAATLRTMLAQSPLVRALRLENALLRAHQSGLCDQMGRIDEELRLAAQFQREFLPQPVQAADRVEFRVLYRPAGYVSGDIYDVIQLDETHIGFFVADAVGHGVPAALMTMFIKRSLQTREIDSASPGGVRIVPPNVALARLNHDLMLHQSQSDQVRTATACYGILDCRSGELRFARAGHPFPFILRADGSREVLAPDGGLLGVFPDDSYDLITTRLHPGDRLLLYSDGFEVAFPGVGKQQRIASDQFEHEFLDLRHGTMDQALDRLVAKIEQQVGSLNQRDDMTVVCVGIRESAD